MEALDYLPMEAKELFPFPTLEQPLRGFRYGIDSFLLARFARFQKSDVVCDLGAGVGLLGLLALARGGVKRVKAVEIQEEMVKCALKNVENWKFQGQMEVVLDNWKSAPKLFGRKSFDVVISNPPYRKLRTGKIPPDPLKAAAKHEIKGGMPDLLETAKALLKNTGRFYLMYPPLRLEELVGELARVKMKIQRMVCVHPYVERPASHFMIEAVLSTPREIHMEAPVIVYRDSEHYMPEIEAWVGEKKRVRSKE